MTLVERLEHAKRSHRPSAELHKRLTQQVCHKIIDECEQIERIDHTITALRFAINDLVGLAADETAAQYLTRNRIDLGMSLKRLDMVCSILSEAK